MNRLVHRSRTKSLAALVVVFITCIVVTTTAQGNVPSSMSYQGFLTDPAGSPIDTDVQVTFNLYTFETSSTSIWTESTTITVAQGLFSLELGAVNPFPPGAFDTPLWLGIEVGSDGEMLPRRPLSTVGFSFKADDALSLQGHSADALDQSAHVADTTTNPHDVTAGQAGAVATGTFGVHAADESAHHPKTTSFVDLSGQAADNQIPDSIARASDLIWDNLGGIPAGFDDDVDNGINSISAGYGLSGGGSSNNVGLALSIPLELDGSVGIGLTDPNRKLYVVDDVLGLSYALKLDNPHDSDPGQTGVGILFSTDGDGVGGINRARGKGGLAYVGTDTWNRGAFHFLQDSGGNANNPDLADAVMTISSSGDVGIGTTIPAAALDVRREGDAYVTVDGGVEGLSGFRIDENDERRWLLFFRQWQGDNLVVRDELGARDTMTFESGTGRIGIGTGTPQATLDVAGDIKVAGNIEMTGNMNWPAKRTYYSITAAAFGPENSSYNYSNYGGSLIWRGDFGPVVPLYRFFAPVNLPHGAKVKKVISYWTDNSPESCALELRRVRHADQTGGAMALMWTSGSSPDVRLEYDVTIENPVVDNNAFAYYMVLYHYANTGDDVEFHTARIEYETTGN